MVDDLTPGGDSGGMLAASWLLYVMLAAVVAMAIAVIVRSFVTGEPPTR